MKHKTLILVVLLAMLWSAFSAETVIKSATCVVDNSTTNGTIYTFSEIELNELNKNFTLSLSRYRGKVILIVNVASFCEFNTYYDLNKLQDKYPKDLAILAFPCNQFGHQEPGETDLEVLNSIRYVRPGNNFRPSMTMFRKIQVNGAHERPLFTYLKKSCPSTRNFFHSPTTELYYSPLRINDIKWNFEKFLVNRQGRPIKRYDSSALVLDMEADIKMLIGSSP